MGLFGIGNKKDKSSNKTDEKGLRLLFDRLWSRPPGSNSINKLDAYHGSPLIEDLHRICSDVAFSLFNFNIYNKKDWLLNKHKAKPLDHPIRSLLEQPCKSEENIDSYDFYKSYPAYYNLCGEWPLIVLRENGLPNEFFVVPPLWVLSFPAANYPWYRVSAYTGTGRAKYVNVAKEDMIIMRNCDLRNPYDRGKGDVEILADEIDTEDLMIKYAQSFFANNATPEIIISSLFRSQSEMDNAKQSWLDRMKGKSKTPAFISGDKTQVIPVGFTQRESDFEKSRTNLIAQGRQHFGLPPEIKGIVENSNRATIEAAEHIYCKHNLMPKILRFQAWVNNTITRLYPDGNDIVVIYDNITPKDKLFLKDMGIQAWNANLITLNEARDLLDLPDEKTELGEKRLRDLAPAFPQFPETQEEPEKEKEELQKSIIKALSVKQFSENVRKAFWDEIITKAEKEENSFIEASKEIGIKQEREFKSILIPKLKGKKSVEEQKKALDEAIELYFVKKLNLSVTQALKQPWVKSIYNGISTASTLLQIKPDFKLFDKSLTKFFKTQGLDKAKRINQTTKYALKIEIEKIMESGGSTFDIEKQIKQTYSALTGETMSAWRAENIARTETMGSLNYGALERYKKSGVTKKEWLSEYDDKVRSYADGDKFDHTSAGIPNPIVDIDDPFEVSNEFLNYPGDSSLGASAGNICACRCTVLPVIED